jgi:hypothetical protein
MIVGTEWLIEAFECEAEKLARCRNFARSFRAPRRRFGLENLGEGIWHQFGGEGGVTGLGRC